MSDVPFDIGYRALEMKCAQLELELAAAQLALRDAASILSMAYDCIEGGRYDEALLHCGAGGARVAKAIDTLPAPPQAEPDTPSGAADPAQAQ